MGSASDPLLTASTIEILPQSRFFCGQWSTNGRIREASAGSRRYAAALLVFLAGTASAGIVAADLFDAARAHAHDAVDIPPAAVLAGEARRFVVDAVLALLAEMRDEF